ncbi:MAG: methyltransferase domain-containing protein, partial [Myxococcota bacterium]
PDPRRSAARFVRADLRALPFPGGSFDGVTSFQVIEHLEDPALYLASIAGLLGTEGVAILTTPNVRMSDGVNPYHVHEFEADELATLLRGHFRDVEVRGIGMSKAVRETMTARSARIRTIMRLDPLRVRERLPRAWIERLFALFALWVRARTPSTDEGPEASWRDFPVEACNPESLDLLAICRGARREGLASKDE